MKKIALLIATVFMTFGAIKAQDTTGKSNQKTKTINLRNRPGDHLMFQLAYDGWSQMPDSISSHQKGFSRGFNAYFMFDKVFKSSPKFSIGIGIGASTSNIIFKRMDIQLNSTTATLPFTQLDSSNHFKKYKLATTFLEIPLELRYASRPDNYNKSFKAAVGIKLGTMAGAHTKGKTLVNKNNNTINTYSEKVYSKRYLNTTRFMATGRIGYGIVSLFGSYGLSNILKDGTGPEMKPFQIGITLSGL